MRIAIIGAGSWGTALALLAGRAGHDVRLWSRNARVVESVNQRKINECYLAEFTLPPNVTATGSLADAIENAALVILGAPSQVTRSLLETISEDATPENILVSATKGIEIGSRRRISEIVGEVFATKFEPRFVCLSGPSFAQEVAAGQPTAIVAASEDIDAAALVQTALSFENLRVYTNSDVVGTELGGSLKNVMAIAAGMVTGLGLGHNSLAAMITRGLAEMVRLARSQGAETETMMGLAGLGDLVLTCTGRLSRNRSVGEELGRGRSLDDILAGMREVAEGVRTTRAVKSIGDAAGVEMPIVNAVHAVLYEGKQPREAVAELMSRRLRGEIDRNR